MKEKISKAIEVIMTDTSLKNDKERIQLTRIVIVTAMIACFVMVCINILNGQRLEWIPTSILAVILALCGVIGMNKSRIGLAKKLAGIAIVVIFTLFTIEGYNEGFAITWSIVIPYATMAVMGLFDGLVTSACLMFVLMAFFWGPLQIWLQYDYSPIFCLRFPLVYILCFLISLFTNYRLKQAQIRELDEKERLKEAVEEERRKVVKITMQTIISISNTVDAKDSYTKQHSERVANISRVIAEKLEWDFRRCEELYSMALLHDIGKIGVPDAILNKEGQLTNEEYPEIKKHPVVGGEILKDLTLIHDVAKGAYYHHERYDGTGYPEGLKGEEIPIEARIIGIADAIDAMNSDRVYRKKKNVDYILKQLVEGRGTQFDPEIDDLVVELIKENKIRL